MRINDIESGMKPSKTYVRKLFEGVKHGYCRLCGEYKQLSEDHFPPRCFGNTSPVMIKTENGREFTSRNGIKFRTTCRSCNSKLGQYDKELEKLYHHIIRTQDCSLIHSSNTSINTSSLIKSLIGHLLGLVFYTKDPTLELCSKPKPHMPAYEPLHAYLTKDATISGCDFYYWYYPYKTYKLFQYICGGDIVTRTGTYCGHVLKFPPISFFISYSNMSTITFNLNKLNLAKEYNDIILDYRNYPHKDFPEMPSENFAILSNINKTIVANKKG